MIDFERLLRRLVDCEVNFIVVGGVAAAIHGSARLTQDLDVVYERTAPNISRLVAAVADLSPYLRGAPPGLPFLFDAITITRGLNFTLQTDAGALDLLGEIAGGGGFENLRDHSIQVSLFGVAIHCLDLETLIHVKRAAGRPKDFETIAELEALRDE